MQQMKITVDQIFEAIEEVFLKLTIKEYNTIKCGDDYAYIKLGEQNSDKCIDIDIDEKEIRIVCKKYCFGRIYSPDIIYIDQIMNKFELTESLHKIIKTRYAEYIIDEKFCANKYDNDYIFSLIIGLLNKMKLDYDVCNVDNEISRIMINNNKYKIIEITNKSIILHGRNFLGFCRQDEICLDAVNSEIHLHLKLEELIKNRMKLAVRNINRKRDAT